MDKFAETQIVLQDEKTIYKNVRFADPGDQGGVGLEGLPLVLYNIPRNTILDFYMHWHEGYEITFPLNGCLDFLVDGKAYCIQPGEVLFIDASKVHGPVRALDTKCHHISFHIDKEFLCPVRSGYIYDQYFAPLFNGELDFTYHLTLDHAITERVVSLLHRIYAGFSALPKNALAMQADFLTIFHLMFSANAFPAASGAGSTNSTIKDAINYIISSFHTPISVKYLADSLNMSMAQFGRLFKGATGMTPKDYILKLRIAHAIEEMQRYPDKKINEIAYDSGFADANYFARIFKEKIGRTPLEYRNFLRSQQAAGA